MIQALVELGKRVYADKETALAKEPFALELIIDSNGRFVDFVIVTGQTLETEVLTSKKGSARFLLDRCEEVLGITSKGNPGEVKKFQLFQDKIDQYKDIPEMKPIFLFYEDEGCTGLSAAQKFFADKLADSNKQIREGNITFKVDQTRLLNEPSIRSAIIQKFRNEELKKVKENGDLRCSVCGKNDSPILDEPHGVIKICKKQEMRAALVSYNEKAFESYGLVGNLNSSICRSCARFYTEGLKYLASEINHKFYLSDNTVALFWTRKEEEECGFEFIHDIQPSEFIKNMLDSYKDGDAYKVATVNENLFYCLTLSVDAARFAVQDWIVLNLSHYKKNIADWFNDIEIKLKGEYNYSPKKSLIFATQRDGISNQNTSDPKELARLGGILFNAFIRGRDYKLPVGLLAKVLNRIFSGDYFSLHRAALLKLIINRITDKNMKSELDHSNRSMAYLCGRLFSIMESMQWKAMGPLNTNMYDRFFAAAALHPAKIFATLMTQKVPVYQKKISGYLAKEYSEIAYLISEYGKIPERFTQIEQAEFALGYFFQSQNRSKKENNTTEE